MQVEYTTTVDDHVECYRQSLLKSGFDWASFLFGWLVIPSLLITIATLLIVYTGYWPVGLGFGLIGLFYLAGFPASYNNVADKSYHLTLQRAGTKGVVGPITLILTDESIVEITEVICSEAKWKNIKEIVETANHTFIFITGTNVAILPRDGFDTDEAYEAVRDFAKSRFKSSVERAKSISDQAEANT